jgi:hypothetical protein
MSLDLPELTKPIYEPEPPKRPAWRFVGAQERPAGHGWQWLRSAFQLFRIQPLPWLLKFLASFGFILIIAMLPGVGQWSGVFVYPVLGWWMFIVSRYHDQQSSAEDKQTPLLQSAIPHLLLLGALSMLASVLLGYVVEDLTGVSLQAAGQLEEGEQPDLQEMMPLMKAMLLHTILSLPITMATYFAPPLIALQGATLPDAIRLSFIGCIKNILPLGWNFTIVLGIAGTSMIFAGLPLLIFAPVFLLMLYTTYLDVFIRLEVPQSQNTSSLESSP